jgi:tetratricopeptide (TPR) repeat protein
MKCSSCGAENGASGTAYDCEYCGAHNVTQKYFDNKSQVTLDDTKNLSPLKKDGLRNYKLGDYEKAIDSLTQYLRESDADSEGWVFLALSEAQTIKPSNFLDRFSSISNAMENAKEYSKDKDLYNNSEIKLSSDLIISSHKASDFYYRNSKKRFESFGGGSRGADSSISILETALNFPNHGSLARIEALVDGINLCSIYSSRYDDIYSDRALSFISQLEELNKDDNLKSAIEEGINNYLPKSGEKFLKKYSKTLLKPKTSKVKTSNKPETKENSNSKATLGCLVILAVIAAIIFLVF